MAASPAAPAATIALMACGRGKLLRQARAIRLDGAGRVNGTAATRRLWYFGVTASGSAVSVETATARPSSREQPGIHAAPAIAAAPAVINAVVDALSHLGVTAIQMPATPERVWNAIQEAKS